MRSAKVVTQEYYGAPSIWELESRGLLMTKESSGTQGCRKDTDLGGNGEKREVVGRQRGCTRINRSQA